MKPLIERYTEKCEEVGSLRRSLANATETAAAREIRLRDEIERLKRPGGANAAVVTALVQASVAAARAPAGSPLGQKITAIKAVRELTGLGLKDAKDLVESAFAGGEPA